MIDQLCHIFTTANMPLNMTELIRYNPSSHLSTLQVSWSKTNERGVCNHIINLIVSKWHYITATSIRQITCVHIFLWLPSIDSWQNSFWLSCPNLFKLKHQGGLALITINTYISVIIITCLLLILFLAIYIVNYNIKIMISCSLSEPGLPRGPCIVYEKSWYFCKA